jgi:hypothetical protein
MKRPYFEAFLCYFLHSAIASYLLCPIVVHITLFPSILNLRVGDKSLAYRNKNVNIYSVHLRGAFGGRDHIWHANVRAQIKTQFLSVYSDKYLTYYVKSYFNDINIYADVIVAVCESRGAGPTGVVSSDAVASSLTYFLNVSRYCPMISFLSVNSINAFFITSTVHEPYCTVRVTSSSGFVSGFVFFHRPALRVSVPVALCTCTPVHSGGRRLQSISCGLIFACLLETTADSWICKFRNVRTAKLFLLIGYISFYITTVVPNVRCPHRYF